MRVLHNRKWRVERYCYAYWSSGDHIPQIIVGMARTSLQATIKWCYSSVNEWMNEWMAWRWMSYTLLTIIYSHSSGVEWRGGVFLCHHSWFIGTIITNISISSYFKFFMINTKKISKKNLTFVGIFISVTFF